MKAKCKTKTALVKPEGKNEIVVYQPDKTLRHEGRRRGHRRAQGADMKD